MKSIGFLHIERYFFIFLLLIRGGTLTRRIRGSVFGLSFRFFVVFSAFFPEFLEFERDLR